MPETKKYFVFISYSSKDNEDDNKWAEWLRHELEHWHLPATYNGNKKDVRDNLREVFRDRDGFSAGKDWWEQAKDRLEQSQNLIVICSPNAKESPAVNQEVEYFINELNKGNDDNVYPFIIEGEKPAECFPEALRKSKIGGDVNKDGGRDSAFIKVVAGMLGVEFSDLYNKYELEKAEQERIEREKKEKLQIAQSRFVAEKAEKLIEEGDSYMARQILYEVLPNRYNPNRPLVREAECSLRKACSIESAILRGHTKAVWSLSFAGEDRIVSTGWGGPSFFWEVNSGYGKVIENSNRRQTACFSPDGSRFLVVGNEVTIYDSATLNRIDSLPVEYPSSATYSPDGKNIFVSTDKLITIFDANTFEQLSTLEAHTDKMNSASISKDSTLLCCIDSSQKAYILNVIDKKVILIPEKDVNAMVFNPNNNLVATASWNGTIKIWNSVDGKRIKTIQVSDTIVSDVLFSPDGNTIASASWDGIVRIWNTKDWEPVPRVSIHGDRVSALSYSKSGQKLASASYDKTIKILDISEKDNGCRRIEQVYGLKCYFSANKKFKAEVEWGKPVRIISMETEETLQLPDDTWQVHEVSFSPNGETFVTASQDYTVRLWETASGKEKRLVFNHGAIVLTAVFSPNGRYLATGTDKKDGNIRIWDFEKNGDDCSRIDVSDHIRSLAFSSNNNPEEGYLACLIGNNLLRIYQVVSKIVVMEYYIPASLDDYSSVYFEGSKIIVKTNGMQFTFKFPLLQELIEDTHKRFENNPLTIEERKQYYLE